MEGTSRAHDDAIKHVTTRSPGHRCTGGTRRGFSPGDLLQVLGGHPDVDPAPGDRTSRAEPPPEGWTTADGMGQAPALGIGFCPMPNTDLYRSQIFFEGSTSNAGTTIAATVAISWAKTPRRSSPATTAASAPTATSRRCAIGRSPIAPHFTSASSLSQPPPRHGGSCHMRASQTGDRGGLTGTHGKHHRTSELGRSSSRDHAPISSKLGVDLKKVDLTGLLMRRSSSGC